MSAEPRKLKVLLLTSAMTHGGSQRFLSILLQHLDRHLFTPMLATVMDADIAYPIPDDVILHSLACELPLEPPSVLRVPASTLEKHAAQALAVGNVVDRIAGFVRRERPDVVICSPEWVAVEAAAALSRFPANTSLVCRVGAPPSVAFPADGRTDLYRALALEYLRDADCIMANSETIAADLAQDFGVDRTRVVVMANPIDIHRVAEQAALPAGEVDFGDGVPTVVSVGRIERVKGLEYLLRAVAEVNLVRPVRCVLVGEGGQGPYLKALSKHLGIEERVHFVGQQENPFRFMSKAAVYALSSLSEGMPNVLVEAMACGCPVVATEIEGGITRELLQDGDCGLIVPRQDAASLAQAILRILDDSTLRETLIVRGRKRADEFGLQRIIEMNQDLFLGLASRPGRSQPETAELSERTIETPDPDYPEETCGPAEGDSTEIELRGVRSPRTAPLGAMAARLRGLFDRAGSRLATSGAHATIKRASAWRKRSGDGRIRLAVLVPTMSDLSMGVATPQILTGLDRDVFNMCLVTIFDDETAPRTPADVEHFGLPISAPNTTQRHGLPEEMYMRYSDELAWMDARANGLAELLGALEADAVLAMGYYSTIAATMARHGGGNTAVVATMHSFAHQFSMATDYLDLYGALLREYLPDAEVVVAPRKAIEQDLIRRFGVDASRVDVIPEPIDADHEGVTRHREESTPVDDSVPARLTLVLEAAEPGEGSHLIEALNLACSQASIFVTICGDPSAVRLAREFARSLGHELPINFVETYDDVAELLPTSLAVIYQGRPLGHVPGAVLDAVAAARPVIAVVAPDDAVLSDFAGANERALSVVQGNAAQLAEAILTLVWDPEVRSQLAENAAKWLRDASPKRVVRRYEKIIQDAIRREREA